MSKALNEFIKKIYLVSDKEVESVLKRLSVSEIMNLIDSYAIEKQMNLLNDLQNLIKQKQKEIENR